MLALAACGGGGGGDAPPPAVDATPAVITVSGPQGSSIVFRESALSAPVTVRLAKDSQSAPKLPAVFAATGDTFAATPDGLPLREVATVRIPIDAATPADAPIVLAQSNADGTWTFRTDTRRQGATLELDVSHLGHYRAVRFSPPAAAAAAAKGQRLLQANYTGTNGIGLVVPGFQANGPLLLENTTPYSASTTVAVVAASYFRPSDEDLCPAATAVSVQHYIEVGSPPAALAVLSAATTAFNPATAGPWSFDLRVFRPVYPGATSRMTAAVTLQCVDSTTGGTYSVSADRTLSYAVTVAGDLVFTSQPIDRTAVIGGAATFEARILGGPALPSNSDQYTFVWERSDDGGASWRPVLGEYQTDALAVSAIDGNLHRYTLANLTLADNGARVRARACWNDCETSQPAQLAVGARPQDIPRIVTQPVGLSTLEGDTADFSFSPASAGIGSFQIQWQALRPGSSTWADIGSASLPWPGVNPSGPRLVTPPATLANDGWQLRAVLSVPGATVTTDAVTWRVTARLVMPTITRQPVAFSAALGGSAFFTAAAEGTAPLSYTWTQDGVPIPGANGPTLLISAVQASSIGDYRLEVRNPAGTATSAAARLVAGSGGGGGGGNPSGWQILPSGTGSLFVDLAVVGGDSNRVVALRYDSTIMRSTDGGATWSTVYARLASERFVVLYKVRFADASVGVAVGDSAILRTADGGATWAVVWRAEDQAIANQTTLAVDWLDANTAIAVGLGRVWRSADRGLTWQPHGSADFSTAQLGSIGGVRFIDANTGVVVGQTTMLRTTDGGLTWASVPGAFTSFDPLYGIVRGGGAGVMVAAGGNGLYRSTDAGATWSRTTFTGYLLGIAAHGTEMVAVGDRGLVLRSVDDGATWSQPIAVPFGQLNGVDFAGATTFVAGAGGLIARHD